MEEHLAPFNVFPYTKDFIGTVCHTGTTVMWINSYAEITVVRWHWFILSAKTNLKQAAPYLFHHWFLDFVPVLPQLELHSLRAATAMQLNEQSYSSCRICCHFWESKCQKNSVDFWWRYALFLACIQQARSFLPRFSSFLKSWCWVEDNLESKQQGQASPIYPILPPASWVR